jgi:hypothetical protein
MKVGKQTVLNTLCKCICIKKKCLSLQVGVAVTYCAFIWKPPVKILARLQVILIFHMVFLADANIGIVP